MSTSQTAALELKERERYRQLREQARLDHVETCKKCLHECRHGRIGSNGYNLWILTQLIEEVRVSLEEIGASLDEAKSYLIASLREDLTRMREAKSYDIWLSYDLAELMMMLEDGTVVHHELGTTEKEISELEARYLRLFELQKSKL